MLGALKHILESRKNMLTRFLAIALLQLAQVFGFAVAPQTRNMGSLTREDNVHAPQLYADKLDFIATLVDLPGAKNKKSYWELSYQLYFVPEENYWAAVRRLPRGGSNPDVDYFPGKIVIAEGHRKTRRLATLDERTITLTGFPFKRKVPDPLRTKFAVLITNYAVKIFDAELNTTVTRSGFFITEPFEMTSEDQSQAIARKTIYLNFGVNPNGTLNGSQRVRSGKTRISP